MHAAHAAAAHEKKGPESPPELASGKLMGHLGRMRSDPLGLFIEAQRAFGDTTRLRLGPDAFTLALHPADIQRVVVDNAASYSKRTHGYGKLQNVLGNGLLTSEGEFWLRQRRIAQPAFRRARIGGLADTMVRATTDLADGWSARADSGERFDLHEDITRVTLRIMGETLLSHDPSDDAAQLYQDLDTVLHWVDRAITSVLPWSEHLPTPSNLEAKRAFARMGAVVRGIIEARRHDENPPSDLLTMLMEAEDEETGERMSDGQLFDEVMTMFLAGHETTANNLTWTLVLLSQHPDVLRRVEAEVDSVLGGRAPTLADTRKLTYLRQVLAESLRLFPPVWVVGRRAEEDDVLGGFHVPKDSYVFLSPYMTHRHPDFWDNPEGFDPERFAPERMEADEARGRPRYAYFPFLGGARQCIGKHMAEMEAILVLATLVSRYRMTLAPGYRVELDPAVTLRPRGEVPITLSRRDSPAILGRDEPAPAP
jgi:cytochrome P450